MEQTEIYSWKIDEGQFSMSKNNSNINISGSEKTRPFFGFEKIVRDHCILMNSK